MDIKKAKEFLGLFQFSDNQKTKNKLIEYIITTAKTAEETKKVLTFNELEKLENLPNPFVDHHGHLFVDTDAFLDMVSDYCKKTKYVKTEIAKVIRETYAVLHTIAITPMKEPDSDE